jgi:hypothetical protein
MRVIPSKNTLKLSFILEKKKNPNSKWEKGAGNVILVAK